MELTINGEGYSFELEDNGMPLLWVLRDVFDLTGTKYSCGIGQCGACTVHVDGLTARSCITPASSLEGKKITTIEGADSIVILSALQENWVAIDVPQCGYCQSGQLMSAAALLSKNPSPSEKEIRDGMRGNLCRCGTYTRILEAIKKTAEDLSS
ncbi:(2Fe-2S)-binding protein [uncultured Croceitalea sp.]|uniref:(2Fe-2S)-binding protein n=1 Tax=uncultured Croceitalea sp. TaxID=1798908 RepID=UPI003305C0A9